MLIDFTKTNRKEKFTWIIIKFIRQYDSCWKFYKFKKTYWFILYYFHHINFYFVLSSVHFFILLFYLFSHFSFRVLQIKVPPKWTGWFGSINWTVIVFINIQFVNKKLNPRRNPKQCALETIRIERKMYTTHSMSDI